MPGPPAWDSQVHVSLSNQEGPLNGPKVLRHKKPFYILCLSPRTYIYGPTLLSLPSKSQTYPFWLWVDEGGGGDTFALMCLKVTQTLVILFIFAKSILHNLYFTSYKAL
jgi:hypothetical protein